MVMTRPTRRVPKIRLRGDTCSFGMPTVSRILRQCQLGTQLAVNGGGAASKVRHQLFSHFHRFSVGMTSVINALACAAGITPRCAMISVHRPIIACLVIVGSVNDPP